MKRFLGLSAFVFSCVFFGLSSLTLAESDTKVTTDRWWEQVVSLFPHTSGNRWVYGLSGKQYAGGGELQVEVKGRQHVPDLKQDALLVEETYPAAAADASPDIMPVLYYPRKGYLVRDTSYIYSNPERTSLLATGNLGEAVVPLLPLWQQIEGRDWKPVEEEYWGSAARLAIAYHLHPEKRETVTVKAGEYKKSASRWRAR